MLVVVLGMHRSGTSLVSSILHAMGVRMGEPVHLEGLNPESQPQGYWEDQDFNSLNRQIIMAAGGHWRTPPPSGRIAKAAKAYQKEMAQLIERKEKAATQENLAAEALQGAPMWVGWGWKDPRNVLTIGAWWPFIKNRDLRIVRVWRSIDAIVDSLMRRGDRLKVPQGAGDKEQRIAWARVADYHWKCTKQFLKATDTTLERCADVRYEDLVRKEAAIVPLNCMATILGLEGESYIEAMRAGMAKIQFRG